MNRAELITAISRKAGIIKKDSEAFLYALIAEIEDTVKSNEKITIDGFGIFDSRTRMIRMRDNGNEEFSACKIPVFKPDERFESLLKNTH